jgi:hypothetical protein
MSNPRPSRAHTSRWASRTPTCCTATLMTSGALRLRIDAVADSSWRLHCQLRSGGVTTGQLIASGTISDFDGLPAARFGSAGERMHALPARSNTVIQRRRDDSVSHPASCVRYRPFRRTNKCTALSPTTCSAHS